MKKKELSISFLGLKQGKHEFAYEINNTFFTTFGYHEFSNASLHLTAGLHKTSNLMELHLEAHGTVTVPCDVTNEPFQQPIQASLKLIIKFGEEYNDDNDEIIILPHAAHHINIAQYCYEMLVLAVPQKRIHPGLADGSLKSDVLDKLGALQPKKHRAQPNSDTDPRWDALKKLLTTK